MAGHVVPDHPERPLERRDLRVPHPVVEHPAVDQDHGRPGAALLVEELPAGNGDEAGLRRSGGGAGGKEREREGGQSLGESKSQDGLLRRQRTPR